MTQFLGAQHVVSELKKEYLDKIDIIFIEKNLDGTREKPHFNVTDIDAILGKKYNRASLETIIGFTQHKE